MEIIILAAVADNGIIGRQNDLPWRLPNDLRHFKQLTTGHTIIMGHNTFKSLPKGALPNRRNIVISRNPGLQLPDAEVYNSAEAALDACNTNEQIFVVGGQQIFRLFMHKAHRMELTHVHKSYKGDVYFPVYNANDWQLVNTEKHAADERHEADYTFASYRRKKADGLD